MASVHKDPRGKSPFWYAAFINSDGRRSFRSTKQRDFKKAEAVCQGWAEAARRGREGVLAEVQAREVVSDIFKRVNGSPLKFQTAEAYMTEWLAGRKGLSANSSRIYQGACNAFVASLGARKAITLGGISIDDLKRFQAALIDAGKAPKTVNLEFGIVKRAFEDARNHQLILANPAKAIENLPEDSAERKTFTREQIKALLGVAESEWKGMILLGACHGLRIGDAAKLTWANVDLQRRTLVFRPQKQQRRRKQETLEIPMHRDLEAYLLSAKIRGKKPDEPLFPSLVDKQVKGDTGLSHTFVRLMEKAGIERAAVTGAITGVGRHVYDLGFHSLRHTSISAQADAGVPEERRRKISGHKSAAVHQRYTHEELDTLRAEVDKVKSFLE